jgi:MFS family permease
LWTAQGTYLTQCAANYSRKRGSLDLKADIGFFTGVFYAIFRAGQISGNIISGFILQSDIPNAIHFLAFILLGCGFFCVITLLFLKNQDEDVVKGEVIEEKPKFNFGENLLMALKLLRKKEMLFLLPLYFYTGVQPSFMWGSYTKDIIAENLGSGKIGFVMTVYSAVDAVSSLIIGKLTDKYSTNLNAIIGFIFSLIFLTLFFVLIEVEGKSFFMENQYIIYLGAGICGLSNAGWTTFSTAVTGKVFDHPETAYSVFTWGRCLGLATSLVISPYMTIEVKIAVVLGFLFIALISLIKMNIFLGIRSNISSYEEVIVENPKTPDDESVLLTQRK